MSALDGLKPTPRGNRLFQELVSVLVEIAKSKDREWGSRYLAWQRQVENSIHLEPRDRKVLKDLGRELIGP
jgi:hypothetical protein